MVYRKECLAIHYYLYESVERIGYNTVVYLASICGINKTYYEAAVIDGATKWQQIKYITLPLLKPVITILLIMAVGGIFKSDLVCSSSFQKTPVRCTR